MIDHSGAVQIIFLGLVIAVNYMREEQKIILKYFTSHHNSPTNILYLPYEIEIKKIRVSRCIS